MGTACSNADSDLMLHQFRLSVLQWNPGAARRQPTQIIAATCGLFHAVTTFSTSRTNSQRTRVTRTSPSCSTRTPLSLTLQFFCLSGSFIQQRHVVHGCTRGSWTLTTPFPFWHSHGHVLLCPHLQCCGQETRCLHRLAPSLTRAHAAAQRRLHWV